MLKILANVEEQFARLRAANKSQEDAFAAMAERNNLLHRAEQELRQLRNDLSQQQQALQRDRDRLNSEQTQFNDQRQRFDAQTSSHQKSQSEFDSSRVRWQDERQKAESSFTHREAEMRDRQTQIERRESELQRERDRLTGLERECQQQRENMSKRASQVEKEHGDLSNRVNQAEANVGQLIKDIETSQNELAAKNESLERASADGKALNARVRELEKSLTKATQQAEKAGREAQELADAHRHAKAVETDVAALKSQIAERDALLAEQRQKLELATSKLQEFAAILADQTPQLERGAAALVMVEQQHEQIERLTQQLAEMQLRTDPEEAIRREQRIAELTEALRQARGQSVNSLGVADIERRNTELTAEVERLKVEAGNATLAAEDARRQLLESSAVVTSSVVQDAAVAERDAKIAVLSAEIEQLRTNADADFKAQVQAQVETEIKVRMNAHQKSAKQSAQAEAAITELRERISVLQQELAEAREAAAATAAASSSAPDPADFAAKLRQKAERVTAVAEHLRRRRQRLKRLRLLVHTQGAQHHAAGSTRNEEIEQEQQQIVELRRLLAASEQTMIRRWARPRAVSSVVWIAVLAVLCAGTSWLAADHFFPARLAASVVIQAKTTTGQTMTDEQAQQWRAWHTGLFSDPAFIQTLSKRLGERRIDQYADAGNLSARLGKDLTIDSSQKNSLILTLAGTDEDEVETLLDVITATVVTESGHKLGNRNDAAWAVAPGERTEQGRVRFADTNTAPISDERLTMALPIFAGLFLTCLAFIGVVYTRLLNAKRVFDQENAALFVDAKISTG